MRSLLIRIFLSFWLIIGITTAAAAVAGFYYAERIREAAENFEIGDTLLEASAVLDEEGRDGLATWLRKRSRAGGVALFVTDSAQRDLLGRELPWRVRHAINSQPSHLRGERRDTQPPKNLRPARPLSQLVAADGEVFTLVALPLRHPYRRWLDERLIPLFLVLALLVSGIVSYLLALTLSRPVQHLRVATVAIADGDLNTRVSAKLHKRRD
jgi:methyl-accepting chemotaxis protein